MNTRVVAKIHTPDLHLRYPIASNYIISTLSSSTIYRSIDALPFTPLLTNALQWPFDPPRPQLLISQVPTGPKVAK